MVKLNKIKKAYLNISGNSYNSEFLNLVNIKNDKVNFDDRTLFLTEDEKNKLNNELISFYSNAVAIININNHYGLICNLPISEYDQGNIKSHELVLPETIQGMLSNFQGYNAETAPVMLLHEPIYSLKEFVNSVPADFNYAVNDIKVYLYKDDKAEKLLSKYEQLKTLYIGDGHHRLYSTSLAKFKDEMLAMLMEFNQVEIQPIHRKIMNVKNEQFGKALQFLEQKFEIKKVKKVEKPQKNFVNIYYKNQIYQVKLIELLSDGFWNNDVYRMNTQIISQAFRIFDNSQIKFLNEESFAKECEADSNDVFIEMAAMSKDEFIQSAQNGNVLPPKTTWMHPKSPSFLIINQYRG